MVTNTPDGASIRTFLIVEDEIMVDMPIAEFLRDCGYDVVAASDAAAAMATVEAVGSVSVVISDKRAPGTRDGLELPMWLKSDCPEMPVLLTSGQSEPGAKVGGLLGCRLIEKPYSRVKVAWQMGAPLDT